MYIALLSDIYVLGKHVRATTPAATFSLETGIEYIFYGVLGNWII